MCRVYIALLACAAAFAQVPHQHHPPRDTGEYARVLNNPSREKWQKPDEVIRALEIRSGEVIADIGAGTGYFARRFASHAAKVYAVDIEPKLLEHAAKDAPENLITIHAAPDDPKLPPNSVDTVFFCNVLHHIESRPEYLKKLAVALRPGGRVVNIDFHKKELPVGPPPSMKLTVKEVVSSFKAAGFQQSKSLDFLPYQYFLVFMKQ